MTEVLTKAGVLLAMIVLGYVLKQGCYFILKVLIATSQEIYVIFACLVGKGYFVHATRFKKSFRLSPSSCAMTLPFLMSSSPFRMASIISGERMMYSVSFMAL